MRYIEQPLAELLPDETLRVLSHMLGDPRFFPGDGAEPCFFDIETCGLQALSAPVYMIGAVQRDETRGFLFRQWFAEGPGEETAVLTGFFESLPCNRRLVHFNGTTFDLPFLRDRCRILGLPPFSPGLSLDFYPLLRRLKPLAGLSSCRQRDLEPLAGYMREDPYDGGTLIRFYTDYVGMSKFNKVAAEERYADLARHNREDLLGLVTLCRLLPCLSPADTGILSADIVSPEESVSSPQAASAEAPAPTVSGASATAGSAGTGREVVIRLTLPFAWPVGLTLRRAYDRLMSLPGASVSPSVTLSAAGTDASVLLRIPLLTQPAKHFYGNYRDYYYLPLENRVIHKSIASHVDRAYRRPAKREEAFEWSRGDLLPQAEEIFAPGFTYGAKDVTTLFPARELARHPDLIAEYAASLLKLFGTLH